MLSSLHQDDSDSDGGMSSSSYDDDDDGDDGDDGTGITWRSATSDAAKVTVPSVPACLFCLCGAIFKWLFHADRGYVHSASLHPPLVSLFCLYGLEENYNRWRLTCELPHPRQASARRQGGVFKVSSASPARAASYAVVYSDDSEGEGWGFDGDDDGDDGHDEFDNDFDDEDTIASNKSKNTAAASGKPPPPTDKPPPRPSARASLNTAATRESERQMTMADVEKLFEWCPDSGEGNDAGNDGSGVGKRARAFPAPTDREIVLLLALDQQTQMALIASLYADRTTAFHEEELGLDEVSFIF